MTPVIIALASVALAPIGELEGGFGCFELGRLQAALLDNGLRPTQHGTSNIGENIILWGSLDGRFMVTLTYPGVPAICVLTHGEWSE